MESQDLKVWVQSRVELLAAPADWEPDLRRARARVEMRVETHGARRRFPRWVLSGGWLAALVLFVVVVALPRVIAQAQDGSDPWYRFERVWNWVTIVWRGPVLLLAKPGATLHVEQMKGPGAPQPVANPQEAQALTGFAGRLPDAVFLPPPSLAVNGPIATAADWQGQRLTLEISATLTATWRRVEGWSELSLIQAPLPAIAAPPGIDLEAFAIGALGMPRPPSVPSAFPWILFGRSTSVPAILSGYLPTGFTAFKEVELNSGPATLMLECSTPEGHRRQRVDRITLLWNVADRAYVLRGERQAAPSVQGWDLAAAVTSVIDIANTLR